MSRFPMRRPLMSILTMVTATLALVFTILAPSSSQAANSAITVKLGDTFYVIAIPSSLDLPGPGAVHKVPGDYATINAAIQAAQDGDNILVSDGIYYEDLWILGEDTKKFYIISRNGPEKTIIHGSGTNSVVTFSDKSKTLLQGFTITNGYNVDYGGGILCGPGSAPSVIDCIISNNQSGKSGGGIHVAESASPLFENCTITGNATLNGNADSNGGGAQLTTLSKPVFKNCVFSSNTSSWIAGAVAIVDSQPQFFNCAFVDNTSVQYAGAISIRYSAPEIINCTFRGNRASATDGRGGAISAIGPLPGTKVVNSIFWENYESTSRLNDIRQAGNTILAGVSYCLLRNGYDDNPTNIEGDPLFLSGSRYLISTGSPAIDQGTTVGAPLFDIQSQGRPKRNGIDIGVDEVP